MSDDAAALRAENERLRKMVRVLADRAERSTNLQGPEFSLFQTAVVLGDQVKARTAELQSALNEQERLAEALRASEAQYHALVDQSLVGIAVVDHGRFSFANPRFCEICGYGAEELGAMSPADLVADAARPELRVEGQRLLDGQLQRLHGEWCCVRKDGQSIVVEIFGNVAQLHDRRVLMCVVQDVSERKRAEAEILALQENLRQQSQQDPLTGLHNRRHLDAALPRELGLAQRLGFPLSLVMADLDHFKNINDHHGHPVGDEVLRRFAALLAQSARSSDLCCRYGGEEFLMLLPGMDQPGAIARAEQVRKALAAVPGAGPAVTASFGVACYPGDAVDAQALVRMADAALYRAKSGGRNRVEPA